MRKFDVVLAIAAMLSLAFVGYTLADSPKIATSAATIGAKAPDFTLQNQDGTDVSLHDFAGKIVVLEWTNPECPVVQRHYAAHTMLDLYKNYKDNGVNWVAINSSNFTTNDIDKQWQKDQSIPYSVLNDAPGNVGHAYGATNTPNMFIIGKDGTLLYRGAIDNDPEGDMTSGKINYVKQALDQILADQAVTVPETKAYGCSVKYKD